MERKRIRNRTAKGLLVIVALFMVGVFVALTYIYPTQLGYRQVQLEKELAQLEKENKQLELTIAKGKSLERIESIAVSRLNMKRPEDAGILVAAQNPGTSSSPSNTSAEANTTAAKQVVASTQGTTGQGAASGTSPSRGATNQKPTTQKPATQKAAAQGMKTKAAVYD
ncbi:MAG: hypothetical protein HPY50_12050 [Firmicutes bacterium]|nr:hypothetical protein [Bacillota bacterium]